MSGKKFLLLLAVLATVGFGASLGVTMLLGAKGDKAARTAGATTRPGGRADALLAGLAAAGAAASDKTLPDQKKVEDLIKDLRERMDEYGRKEARLDERERRLAQAEENLQRRAKELEALRMELVGPLTRLKDAVAELERSRTQVDKEEKANLQRIAAAFEKMDAVRGSGIMVGMCANDQTDDVVKILFYMNDRAAGKILTEMSDQNLAARLTGMMQRIKEQG